MIHCGSRPTIVKGAYRPLPEHSALALRRIPGVSVPGSGARLPLPATLAKHLSGCDLCYFDNGYALQDAVVLKAAKKIGLPVISGHHAVIKFGGLHDLVWEAIGKRLLPRFSAVHVLNRRDARYVQSLAAKNVRVIPMCVDLSEFSPRNRNDQFTVLFVGRFHAQKGIDRLVRIVQLALERFGSQIRFAIIGSGPLESRVASIACLQNVQLLGPLGHDRVAASMAAAHVLLVPSRYETFGTVAAEALASGTPVIASDVGAIGEMVQDERGQTVEDPDDASQWCDAIAAELACFRADGSRTALRTRAIRRYAERTFAFDVVASAFDELLASAL